MTKWEITGVAVGISLLFLMWLSISLCPLWIWLDNGKSIHGGINDTPLSFGLAFIGTALVNGGVTFGIGG